MTRRTLWARIAAWVIGGLAGIVSTMAVAVAATPGPVCPDEAGRPALCVRPPETDPAIRRFTAHHAVLVNPRNDSRAPLFLWLTGASLRALESREILGPMTDVGFRVIALQYNITDRNRPQQSFASVYCPTQRPADRGCSERFNRMRAFGEGISFAPWVDNSTEESISNRLAKLLSYLDSHDPGKNWGAYLSNGKPEWSRIIVAGQSYGADLAAMIAKNNLVSRVVLFSGPANYVTTNKGERRAAPWLSGPGETPAIRWFGAYHSREAMAPMIEQAFAALKIPEANILKIENDLTVPVSKLLCGKNKNSLISSNNRWVRTLCEDPYSVESCCSSDYSSQRMAFIGVSNYDLEFGEWYERSFKVKFKQCSERSQELEWCPPWIETMEKARPKTTDINKPEWQRVSFYNNMIVCSTLLPPSWCADWFDAMNRVSATPPYRDLTDPLIARRDVVELDSKQNFYDWKEVVEHVGLKTISQDDIMVIDQHIRDGDGEAMEIKAYMYYEGRGVKPDIILSYQHYGLAMMAGRTNVRPNLDALWARMDETQKLQAIKPFTPAQ